LRGLALGGLLLTALSGCATTGWADRIPVRLTGAQIPTELVESWLDGAKGYDFVPERPVNPTWSQVGFQALARGECDIACTDRRVEPRELEQFAGRELRGYRVAFYGYALYVHPDNPVDSIFARHISLVFQKKITDWKELAGGTPPIWEGPIRLYGPHKMTRGGDILMRQANVWFAQPTWETLDSDAQIVERVAADPQALGFASIGFEDGVRYLGIRMRRTGKPAFPSLEEIEREDYGLAKVIYVYFVAPPDRAAAAVLEYLFSPEGQQAIEQTQVWPIPRERAEVPSTP